MSSIIGNAELLTDGMLGELLPDQHRIVEVISRNGDRLLSLADDLLLLASVDNDTWQQQSAPTDLATVVRESAGAVAPLVALRALDLSYELPEEAVNVFGDLGHLERAVTNLLSNAVKFTPDGGRIHVAVTREGAEAIIEVTDTGMGIPEDELEGVFVKFFRSSAVQEQAIPGSGLGLAIVKAIVESHDGQIDVHSVKGEGTRFSIRLPVVA